MDDFRCKEFADLLEAKKDHYPYSDKYMFEVHDSQEKSGSNEREHMVIWFRLNETTGSGSYARNKPNYSAQRCYNSLMNAASLLWIAEAVGIEETLVEQAFNAAVEAGNYRCACGAIRKVIPWNLVYNAAANAE